MSADFKLKCTLRNSNIYIQASGEFTLFAAETLSTIIVKHHSRVERIFVDIHRLDVCDMEASAAFKHELAAGHVSTAKLFFKGEQGFALAADGCKVLVMKKKQCQCVTPCAQCACAARSKKHEQARVVNA